MSRNRPKTAAEVEAMRTGGGMLAAVLRYLVPQTQPGVTTKHLADLAATELKRLGGQPAFLGYQGYPDVLCISVNQEVQHGIPGRRQIHEGDIVNLDFGVLYQGLITDAGITIGVGQISPEAAKLITATKEALEVGIAEVKAGARIGDIAAAVERRLNRDNLGVIEDLVGHGVGHELHEDPIIPNFGHPGTGQRLTAGMTIAIEPMATLGSHQIILQPDGWTFVTADGSWASHFEHTVLVTETGAEVLTG